VWEGDFERVGLEDRLGEGLPDLERVGEGLVEGQIVTEDDMDVV